METHVEFHSEMGKKINLWAFLAARGKIDDGDVIIIKRHTGRRHRCVTLPTVYERGWRGRERYDEGNMIVLIK